MIVVSIILSIAALVVASLAYFKARREPNSDLKMTYTEDSIIIYDKTGKVVLMEQHKL